MRDGGGDWLARVRELAPEQVFVQHSPPTPRYGRPQSKLTYLLREGTYLGARGVVGQEDRREIALWARSPWGRGHGPRACTSPRS